LSFSLSGLLLAAIQLKWDSDWGGENRSISDGFGDETNTTLFHAYFCLAPKGRYIPAQGNALGKDLFFCQSP
jgi:hypothetical protein